MKKHWTAKRILLQILLTFEILILLFFISCIALPMYHLTWTPKVMITYLFLGLFSTVFLLIVYCRKEINWKDIFSALLSALIALYITLYSVFMGVFPFTEYRETENDVIVSVGAFARARYYSHTKYNEWIMDIESVEIYWMD